MKKYWKNIVIASLLILIGVLLAQMCRRVPETNDPAKVTIDSLRAVNVALVEKDKAKTDSVDRVIDEKEKEIKKAEKNIQAITEKYNKLRQQKPPEADTVVKYIDHVDGLECLEKMPIIKAQLEISDTIIESLKAKCRIKDLTNMQLQQQFYRAIALNDRQQKQAEKDAKKIKRMRRIAIAGSIVGAVGIIAIIAR